MTFLVLPICLLVLAFSPDLSAQSPSASQTAPQPEAPATTIRTVNFRNFTYPWPKDLIDPEPKRKTFRLKNGTLPITRDKYGDINGGASLQKVVYGDVTGDGLEEAMIWIQVVTGGTGHPDLLYVYTMQDNQAKLLWHLETGDRAARGMRKMYAQRGHLVLELFGPGSQGDCCPTQYTRTTYKWLNNRFKATRNQIFPLQRSN